MNDVQEAQHVETPPLKQQTANGQPRSLFMEIKHSLPLDHLDDAGSSSSESLRATPRVFSYRKNQLIAKREWWDAPKAPVRRDPVRDVSFFEFNMPEHLPSSPMCPANPLHKGKLKVCVVCISQVSAQSHHLAIHISWNRTDQLFLVVSWTKEATVSG